MPKQKPVTVRGRKVKRLAAQPRVTGERRKPRATSLLRLIDEKVSAEMKEYGACRSYVLASLAAVALGLDVPPDLLYRSFPRLHLVRR